MKMNNFNIINGDSFELLKQQQDNSFDSIITDPPYGLNFMNKDWDAPDNIAFKEEFWREAIRVLKPGGHLLAFSGSRTYHWMAIAIEKAGFEIRDQIMWLYGSGFPKSKTSLKPAHEPIVMARKPFKGTYKKLREETGLGLNIDESRVPFQGNDQTSIAGREHVRGDNVSTSIGSVKSITTQDDRGRFPANVIHDSSDEVIGSFPNTKKGGSIQKETYEIKNQVYGQGWGNASLHESYGDSGSAARFFYGSKCSKTDRNEGLNIVDVETGHLKGGQVLQAYREQESNEELTNNHPTVKPTDLMAYLVRLVTPQGGRVLDPFNGSGSTGKAIAYLNKTENKNYSYVGMELQEKFVEVTKRRIKYTLENEIWLEKKK